MYNTLIQQDKVFKAGIYIRLSEADEGKNYETDSESVLNQRNILMKFIKEKGFIIVFILPFFFVFILFNGEKQKRRQA